MNNEHSPLKWNTIMTFREEIYGISALWIILFHVMGHVGFVNIPRFPSIIGMGNMGVDVFLFLSALGLFYSMKKHSIKEFYKNRIKRVILPYLIVAVVYFIWFDFYIKADGIWQFVLNVTTLNYWITGDHPTWYVAFIFVAYLVYPFLYKAFKWNKCLSYFFALALSICFEILLAQCENAFFLHCERALSRIPVFLTGMFASFYFDEKNPTIKWPIIFLATVLLLIGVVVFPVNTISVLPIYLVRYLYCILGICMVECYHISRVDRHPKI